MNHLEKRLEQKEVSDKKEADRAEHAAALKKYKVVVSGKEHKAHAVIVMAKSKEEALKEHKGSVKASEVSDEYTLPGQKSVVEDVKPEKKAKK